MLETSPSNRFFALQEPVLRDLLFASIGTRFDEQPVISPSQGVNNNTFLVGSAGTGGVVLKLRPISSHAAPVDSPYWPDFTRALWGEKANGDIRSLGQVSELLQTHGKVRVPKILHISHTLEHVPAPFTITEMLQGVPFDWNAHPVDNLGAEQLGRHLGSLHRDVPAAGFGIFEGPLDPGSDWWPRFSLAYTMLAQRLAAMSTVVAQSAERLLAVLDRAIGTGTPDHFGLICIDQAPTHYLRDSGGGIGAMVDIEGHLWAPVEYELAMVSLWMPDFDAFQGAYSSEYSWPVAFAEAAAAYRVFTWMQWIYCMRVLTPDRAAAESLESRITDDFLVG